FYVLFGLVVAATGSVRLGWIWMALILIGLSEAFIEYIMWGYDYGLNLTPDAAIQVPGMTYQPPLIGTKQLLNMNAGSWPHWGTAYAAVSILLGLGVLWMNRKKGAAA